MDSTKLYRKAIEKWGVGGQVEMIIEESSELIKAIQKGKRISHSSDLAAVKKANFDICDEIADVKIMIEQAELIFDQNLINERYQYKLARLEKRLSTPDEMMGEK